MALPIYYFLLFFVTAIAEILGCYFPYIYFKKQGSPWLLVCGALCLIVFSYLLTLHPQSAGRIYATYGGIYIVVSVGWMIVVEKIIPTTSDYIGAAVSGLGATIIFLQLFDK